MKRNLCLTFGITLGLVLLSVLPAAAGGWAVITLDDLPAEVIAGETFEIGFMVRQHGISPMADLTPSMNAVHAGSSRSIRVEARPQGKSGHYVATLTLPEAGRWDWIVRAFSMEQPMPPITATAAQTENMETKPGFPPQIWAAGIGLTGAAGAALLMFRKQTGWAVAVLIAALAFSGGGFALAASQAPATASELPSTRSPIEQGEAIFLAKGCITCHNHNQVASKYAVVDGFSGPAGSPPDLSSYAAGPAFLRLWLADPAGVKPGTTMPNLELTEAEIESLIAFLLKDSATAGLDAPADEIPKSCPVTLPPEPPFIPPQPYPPNTASDGEFWYGTAELWTMLLVDGVWQDLPYHDHADGRGHFINKLFWWNEDFDWQKEEKLELKVTARRLDSPAPVYETSEATNAYTSEFGSAILTGVEIPTPGCWEITGTYQGHSLRYIIWLAP